MNRKLFILAGCLCLLGTAVRAQAPVAQFTASVTSGCAPLGVKFTDQSTNNPTTWEWDFGDGHTSSSRNPLEVYATPGTYTITLIVKNASGAAAIRDTNYITVYASPSVSFGVSQGLACAPATIQFLQYSQPGQGSITNYAWNFGDGASGNGPTPQHLYTSPGYYNVSLTVTNSGGCSSTATYNRVIRLVNGVQTNFTWTQGGSACTAPFSLNFLNQTSGPGAMTYAWSFAGGATPVSSNTQSPGGISYPSSGSYPVTLIASSSLGCADTLTKNVPLTATVPSIIGPTSGCINTPITFSDSSSPAPLSVSWDFGDGNPGSNQPTAAHTFTAAGTYNVTLTANYANCSSTSSSTITIGASLNPSFSGAPLTACQAPLAVQFTDNDLPADVQWTWNFGDGIQASSPTGAVTHNYTAPGTYTVTLIATSASGCTGTDSISKYVAITAPVINITGQGACVGQAYTPTYTVTTVDPVATYSWNAPNATPSIQTGLSPSFTFSSTGFFPVTVTITTSSGCTATQNFNVQVGTPTPAAFTYNPPSSPASPICGTALVAFTSTSAPADQWYWNFGDGFPLDSGSTVSHRFLKFGTETVTLAVTHDGCVTTIKQPVTVNPPIPDFGYIVDCAANSPLAKNLTVTFVDTSLTSASFGAISYDWNFGDPTPDYVGSPPNNMPGAHPYAAPGTYPVTLTITNGTCMASFVRNVTVQNFIASFSTPHDTICSGQTFTLTSTTTPAGIPSRNYIWAFGPGDSTYAGHTFVGHLRGIRVYNATLTVTDSNGCRYVSPVTPLTMTGPAANFFAPTGGCDDSTITFTDASGPSILGTFINQYTFRFGDSSIQSFYGPPFPPLTHVYADTGSYTVIESVVDNAGCITNDTIVNAVQITAPHPLFVEPDSFYCPNTPATFTNFSTGYGLTYSWNFGDGSTGPFTQQNPQHSFPSTNGASYAVTLTIRDKYGCVMDTTETMNIDSPVAAFTIADTTAICAPLQTLFIAAPLHDSSLYWLFGDGRDTTYFADTIYHYYNSLDTFTATLVVVGPGGCVDSASRKVFLTNPITAVFNFTPKTACDSVVAQFTILPPDYTRFTLQFGDNTADSSQDLSPVHTYRSPNTFNPLLYLTDATGCIVTRSDTLLTVLGAIPFFTASPAAFCDTGTVDFVDYTITNNGVQSKTYSFGDGSNWTQPPPLNVPANTSHFYNTPGNLPVTLNVVTLANCAASFTDTVRVYQTPNPIVSDSGNLCQGLVQFLGKLATPDVDTVYWQWDFGDGQTANVQDPLIKINAGTYNVHLKAFVSLGCSDTASASITINPNPTITGPKEITTPLGVPVMIPFTYSPDVNIWTWTPAANLSCADCANPTATLTFAQTYSVLVSDSNNCTDTASILINTVCNDENYFLPNTFSPNGDGVNDYFYPRGTSIYNIQSMSVFNRWGQLVFQRKNFPANAESMGWDGTFNGKAAPSDAYVYIVEVICANAQVIALHGNVTLIR